MLDALVERDADRAQVSKDKAAAKKAAAKLEKELEKDKAKAAENGQKDKAKAAENGQKKKQGKGSGSACCNSAVGDIVLRTPKKAAAAKEGKPTAVKNPKNKPSMSHEATRTQYLVRTGVKGAGQSTPFKYGEEAGMSQQDAKAAAEKKLSELA